MNFLRRLLGLGERDPAADFARHLPVIAQAVHDLQLGIYWRLSKEYERRNLGEDGYSLAHCVVWDLFLVEPVYDVLTRPAHEFAQKHADLITKQVREAIWDKHITNALSIAYAAQIMELGWLTGTPFSEESQRVVEKANSLGIEITDIVSLWGSKAIVNLHAFARQFRDANV